MKDPFSSVLAETSSAAAYMARAAREGGVSCLAVADLSPLAGCLYELVESVHTHLDGRLLSAGMDARAVMPLDRVMCNLTGVSQQLTALQRTVRRAAVEVLKFDDQHPQLSPAPSLAVRVKARSAADLAAPLAERAVPDRIDPGVCVHATAQILQRTAETLQALERHLDDPALGRHHGVPGEALPWLMRTAAAHCRSAAALLLVAVTDLNRLTSTLGAAPAPR